MAKTEDYEPEQQALMTTTRPADDVLAAKLTGKTAVEDIATALRAAAFDFDPDDLVTIATADGYQVTDAAAYARGYELLEELATLEARIVKHYERVDKPLNFLVRVVRGLKGPQTAQVAPVKRTLSQRLGLWKQAEDQRAQAEARRRQQVADDAARAAQDAKAAQLERVAQTESNPKLAASFQAEAEAVRAADVHAAPVEVENTVPAIVGGYTRTVWKCEFVDLKALMQAYVDGKCFLDEEALKEGLQSSLDAQARALGQNLGKAFPGTKAVPVPSAVTRRR